MVTRIWSPESLEVPADFTLTLEIPAQAYNVKNADGTAPSVTLAVTGPTVKVALSILSQINKQDAMFEVVTAAVLPADLYNLTTLTDEEFALQSVTIEEVTERLGEALVKTHEQFPVFAFSAKTTEDETVEIKLTAPSGAIALEAFEALTSDQKLQSLAASYMPLDTYGDDDGYGDY